MEAINPFEEPKSPVLSPPTTKEEKTEIRIARRLIAFREQGGWTYKSLTQLNWKSTVACSFIVIAGTYVAYAAPDLRSFYSFVIGYFLATIVTIHKSNRRLVRLWFAVEDLTNWERAHSIASSAPDDFK